ncbi:complex I 24 kDa subunit family protein [Desulfotignum balticum]|jgi:NADH-quinone oxidoreductase subunit E|uniref:complex I 24 kDa subunit family protein n=1 Tax=Desulfotignum balticum TaxID=115781 RepID=UPI000462652A|nr:NAD(P)H-dependent oxidoreductase subunit E [Desulfotignum balticum]
MEIESAPAGAMPGIKLSSNANELLRSVDQIIEKHHGEASNLLQIMLDIQSENNWLSKQALARVSEKLSVPMTRIQHIATFYKAFSLVPKGRHKVHICVGTACHVRGATRILDTVEEATGIKPGETDLDLKFSLETVNCLGCCALGPVMEVDGKVHGKMSPVKASKALKTYE